MTEEVDPKLDLMFERVVDVRPELVWKAWTEPEHLKKWFCPRPWMTTEAEIDLRPGGKFRTVMQGPNGEVMPNVGCYLDVVPNERLVFTGALGPGYRPALLPDNVPVFTAILTFTPEGSGTRYRAHVLHRDEQGRDAHAAMGFHEGWGKALDQLVELFKNPSSS